MAAGISVGCSPTETIHAAPMVLAVQYSLAVMPSRPPGLRPPPSHRHTSAFPPVRNFGAPTTLTTRLLSLRSRISNILNDYQGRIPTGARGQPVHRPDGASDETGHAHALCAATSEKTNLTQNHASHGSRHFCRMLPNRDHPRRSNGARRAVLTGRRYE